MSEKRMSAGMSFGLGLLISIATSILDAVAISRFVDDSTLPMPLLIVRQYWTIPFSILFYVAAVRGKGSAGWFFFGFLLPLILLGGLLGVGILFGGWTFT